MGRAVPFLLAILLVSACSQRVTPEEEYDEGARERPLLPAGRVPDPLAGGAGRAGMTQTIPEEAVGQTIRGTLRAAPDAAGPPGAVLYLFVRAADVTGGPPLAVQRLPAGSLPLEFAIGPGDAMMPGTTFPDRVVVEARLDEDGDAMTTGPGDLTARSEPVQPGAEGVALELSP